MQSLGLNETSLAERCSLAATCLFANTDAPNLTRERISKILMHRQDNPAKSAAKLITLAELTVLANVLEVSIEWLVGQEENRDPVVWNVLAQPDRIVTFAHLLEEYEELSNESICWSRHPLHAFNTDAYVHAFNHLHYTQKHNSGNPRALIEFYNSLARLRRKWLLRRDRTFKYTQLIYKSHFEQATCGQGIFAAISRTILLRNLDAMLETISDPSLKMTLIILTDTETKLKRKLENYEILATSDNLLSVWQYHNGDIGWSEHPNYVEPNHQLLDDLRKCACFRDVPETIEYIKSLKSGLARR